MKTLFLAMTLICGVNCQAQVSDFPAARTPQEAVKILQGSNDFAAIVSALKIAASNAATRADAIAFLDGPNRDHQFERQWASMHSSVPSNILDNPQARQQWTDNHLDEVKQYDDSWYAYRTSLYNELENFFCQPIDQAGFELFTHFAESDFFGSNSDAACSAFIDHLKPGSPMEPVFIDYVDHGMIDLSYVGYADSTGIIIPAGLLNARTGEFKSYLTSEKLAAAKTGKEVRTPFLEEDGPTILAKVNSDAAYDRLRAGIVNGTYPEKGLSSLFHQYFYMDKRYDHRAVSLFLTALEANTYKNKANLVYDLFEPTGVIDGKEPPSIDDANPVIFPQILAFIGAAQKLTLPDVYQQWLSRYKAHILRYYADHNLTLPTDSELTKIAAESTQIKIQPAVAPKPITSPKISPTTTDSSSTSLPLYVFLGAVVVIGLVLLLRRK